MVSGVGTASGLNAVLSVIPLAQRQVGHAVPIWVIVRDPPFEHAVQVKGPQGIFVVVVAGTLGTQVQLGHWVPVLVIAACELGWQALQVKPGQADGVSGAQTQVGHCPVPMVVITA